MAWGALIGGAVSLGMGLYGQSKADDAAKQQMQMQEQEIQLGRDQLQFSREQYEDYKAKFDPAYNRMLAEIDQDLEPNFGLIAGDVKDSFQSARGQERREMQRYGINPKDGSKARMEREYGIREAASHVGARNVAREQKRGLKYARLADAASMAAGMQGNATSSMNNAFANSMNSYGNAANMWGGIANQRYQSAWNNAQGVGNFIGGVDWGGIWDSISSWGSGGTTKTGGSGGFSGGWGG